MYYGLPRKPSYTGASLTLSRNLTELGRMNTLMGVPLRPSRLFGLGGLL